MYTICNNMYIYTGIAIVGITNTKQYHNDVLIWLKHFCK